MLRDAEHHEDGAISESALIPPMRTGLYSAHQVNQHHDSATAEWVVCNNKMYITNIVKLTNTVYFLLDV